MARKWSESAAVRWALEQAIKGATPAVGGLRRDTATAGGLPRGLAKLPHERPGQPRAQPLAAATTSDAKRCTEMHQNAPLRTGKTTNVRNEPNRPLARSPVPNVALPEQRESAASCTELHRNAPKCTGAAANVQNEPNAASDAPLTPRQLAAIALLFSGRSYSAVGRQLKINRSTLFRWRQSPVFSAEIRRRYLATTRQRGEASRGADDWWRDVPFGHARRAAANRGSQS